VKIRYSDKKIIADIECGDIAKNEYALRYLYKEYYPLALRFVKQNSGNDEEAEDVFQDAVISFYENVKNHKFRGDSSIKTYLYSTIRNTWYTRFKKASRMSLTDEFSTGLIAYTQPDPGNDMDSSVKDILNRISESCKKLLVLYYYDNFSMKEIVEELGFSNEKSAKTQKYKCMQKLIHLIDKNPGLKSGLFDLLQS